MLIRVRRSQCGIEKIIYERDKQLGDEEVCEDVSNDATPLDAVIAKTRKRGD